MKPLSITEIVTACGGRLASTPCDGAAKVVRAVSTDTREISDGSLFVALRGENFDGHDYAAVAARQGASCLMLEEVPEGVELPDVPVVLVENTLYGLQRLARWYRHQLDIHVIAITGSNGKTSVKDFTASVIAEKFKVNATKGNLNNHIGLPLSVLSTEEDDQVCIWEMGMNHAGEISLLCEIAGPDTGIITNIGTAHIEFLGSRDGIAEEKASLARALSEHGTLIVTASCDYVDYLIERANSKVIVAGNCRGAVRAEALNITAQGSTFQLCIDNDEPISVTLSVSGKHMVNNALLAAAAGYSLGMSAIDIAAGLEKTVLTSGRLRRYMSDGITVIDDTYNANPDSVIAAIETLSDLPVEKKSRRVVVLGMMAELGVHADKEHFRVGELAAQKGLQVVSVGAEAVNIYEGALSVCDAAEHFEERSEAATWLKHYCKDGDIILFKGSRMAGMERVMRDAFPEPEKSAEPQKHQPHQN